MTLAQASPPVHVLEVSHAISPASSDFIVKHLRLAIEADAELVVIQLDTPGGLDQSMRTIIKAILASDIPVATWVAPSGSRAASAGTFILYASHIAAMAPATNVGAATPVPVGASPQPAAAKENSEEPNAMKSKITNDAVAYIRSLAELRGRNADWAGLAVTEASSLSAKEALEKNVIDLIVDNLDELIHQLKGRKITLGETGKVHTLDLSNPEIIRIKPNARYEFLAFITDPSIAYLLLMIGFWGLILEFYNPGTALPGIAGAICLALGLFGLLALPISYAGLLLIVLGFALMMAEVMLPSFGVFGIGGTIAFAIGSVILVDTDLPAYQISLLLITAISLASALIVIGLGTFALGAQRQKVKSGVEGMIGGSAYALHDFDQQGRGRVRAFGELWDAKLDAQVAHTPPQQGEHLKVTEVNGLLVTVVAQPSEAQDTI